MAFSKIAATTLSDDIISGKTALAEAPADTDELLLSDAGTLKRIDYSYLKDGSGNLVHIATNKGTNSVGDVSINDCFSATYDTYLITFAIANDRAGNYNNIRFQADDDSTFDSGYKYIVHGYEQGGGGTQRLSTSTSSTTISLNWAASQNDDSDLFSTCTGFMYVYNPYNDGNGIKTCQTVGNVMIIDEQDEMQSFTFSGMLRQTSYNVAGIRFRPSANYITNRNVVVYGLKSS